MKNRIEEQHPSEFRKHGSAGEDRFGQALQVAVQPAKASALSKGFAKRVAEEARQRAAQRARENLWFRTVCILLIAGLVFCGLLGWMIAQPTGLSRLLDGPFPLVLTALGCLLLGTRFANNPSPAKG